MQILVPVVAKQRARLGVAAPLAGEKKAGPMAEGRRQRTGSPVPSVSNAESKLNFIFFFPIDQANINNFYLMGTRDGAVLILPHPEGLTAALMPTNRELPSPTTIRQQPNTSASTSSAS